jgi:hypothetical protein
MPSMLVNPLRDFLIMRVTLLLATVGSRTASAGSGALRLKPRQHNAPDAGGPSGLQGGSGVGLHGRHAWPASGGPRPCLSELCFTSKVAFPNFHPIKECARFATGRAAEIEFWLKSNHYLLTPASGIDFGAFLSLSTVDFCSRWPRAAFFGVFLLTPAAVLRK